MIKTRFLVVAGCVAVPNIGLALLATFADSDSIFQASCWTVLIDSLAIITAFIWGMIAFWRWQLRFNRRMQSNGIASLWK